MRTSNRLILPARALGIALAVGYVGCSGGVVTVAENDGTSLLDTRDAGATGSVAGTSRDAGGGGMGSASGSSSGSSSLSACPLAQWDCSGMSLTCNRLVSASELPSGCVCDRSRPTSGAECAPTETVACFQVRNDAAQLGDSDFYFNIQCSCIAVASADLNSPEDADCLPALEALFPISASYFDSIREHGVCIKPCAAGTCPDDPLDMQRQQGIAYGCAPDQVLP